MHKYILKTTIKSKTATVRVFSPILTDDERAKRMKSIHNAAAVLLKETQKIRR
jgi:hypothetical protein